LVRCERCRSQAREIVGFEQEQETQGLKNDPPASIDKLLGIEGRAAFSYFTAWQALPLKWKGLGRRPIPDDWHQVGPRTSGRNKIGTNRNATHPVNAISNYAYAVLESQVRMQIVTHGYDPTIGFLHTYNVDRPALVFDLMEPQRPIVDRKVLKFVQAHTFHSADFTIRSNGVCRSNPELARLVVRQTTDSQTWVGGLDGYSRPAPTRNTASSGEKGRD
jgi:CRISPR-associated protein Cas1